MLRILKIQKLIKKKNQIFKELENSNFTIKFQLESLIYILLGYMLIFP